MPAAVLPPPPTEPELIEQWTRAMFTDHVGLRDGAQQQVPWPWPAVGVSTKEARMSEHLLSMSRQLVW